MSITSRYFPLAGGLDLATPSYQQRDGTLSLCFNYVPKLTGGYARIGGNTLWDAAAVPGQGAILGVAFHGAKVQAWRNAVGGATAEMHESSGSGWTTKKTGLTPNGRYDTFTYDFGAGAKLYGCSGVHQAFEWDGTTWADLSTGLPTDTPVHIIAHKHRLFAARERRVVGSDAGDPATYGSGIDLKTRTEITGLEVMQGDTLGIFGRHSLQLLTGTGPSDWNQQDLAEHGHALGAIRWSLQQMGSRVLFLDDPGLQNFATTDAFGSFADQTISLPVQRLIKQHKSGITASCLVRDGSQYRLFYGSRFLILTLAGNKVLGITEGKYPVDVKCTWNGEDASGNELVLFGDGDGYVHRMEDGTDFSGTAVAAAMRLRFNHLRSPSQVKRFFKAIFDMRGGSVTTVRVIPSFNYHDAAEGIGQDVTLYAGGALLGDFILGIDRLGSPIAVEGECDIRGIGHNVSLLLGSSSGPHEIDGLSIHYAPARMRR